MTSRLSRAVIVGGRVVAVPEADAATDHFREILTLHRQSPAEGDALAWQRLRYFCGHIDQAAMPATFIPMGTVAEHFTALTPVSAPDTPLAFGEELATYLSLLGAEFREGKELPDFRGAAVSLTFDVARFEANLTRFRDGGRALALDKTFETPGNLKELEGQLEKDKATFNLARLRLASVLAPAMAKPGAEDVFIARALENGVEAAIDESKQDPARFGLDHPPTVGVLTKILKPLTEAHALAHGMLDLVSEREVRAFVHGETRPAAEPAPSRDLGR